MNEKFRSTILQRGKFIDCRALTLSLEFYRLNYEQVFGMCLDLAEWIQGLICDNFIVKWSIGGIRSKDILSSLKKAFDDSGTPDFLLEGFAENPIVFNYSSLRKQMSFISQDMGALKHAYPAVSVDYRSHWERMFPEGRVDNQAIESQIIRIFRTPQKKHISVWVAPDIQASFCAHPYSKFPNLFYGSFTFSISAFCLDSQISEFADLLLDKALYLATSYSQLNARVMLQPFYATVKGNSPYMRYFGSHLRKDGSHEQAECAPHEWYSTYYLNGIEWANIISPLAQGHFPTEWFNEANISNGIQIQKLQNGCILAKMSSSIEEYDITDSIVMKRTLLPALFPGGSYIPLKALFKPIVNNSFMVNFPRSDWAIVPVLDDEVYVVGTDLVFQSNKLIL